VPTQQQLPEPEFSSGCPINRRNDLLLAGSLTSFTGSFLCSMHGAGLNAGWKIAQPIIFVFILSNLDFCQFQTLSFDKNCNKNSKELFIKGPRPKLTNLVPSMYFASFIRSNVLATNLSTLSFDNNSYHVLCYSKNEIKKLCDVSEIFTSVKKYFLNEEFSLESFIKNS
jgi:hypothetical protein